MYVFLVPVESEDQQRLRFQVELEFVQCLANPNYLHCKYSVRLIKLRVTGKILTGQMSHADKNPHVQKLTKTIVDSAKTNTDRGLERNQRLMPTVFQAETYDVNLSALRKWAVMLYSEIKTF